MSSFMIRNANITWMDLDGLHMQHACKWWEMLTQYETLKEEDLMGHTTVDGRIILKWILK